jgi:signal transduction histidine kinase/HAMP domain-containing protein
MLSSQRLDKRLVRAFMLTAAVPLLITALLTGYANLASLRQEMDVHQRDAALSEAAYTSTFLRGIESEMGGFVTTLLESGLSEPEMQEGLSGFINTNKAYREISIMNSTGQEIARVTRNGLVASDQLTRRDGEEEFFRAARGETFYSRVRLAGNDPYLSLSVPIRLGDNRPGVDWVANANIALSGIWDHIEGTRVGQSGYVFLVDQRGTLIAYRDPALVRQNMGLSDLPPVREVMAGTAVGTVREYPGLNGVRVLGIAVRVKGPDWILVSERPVSEAYAPIRLAGFASAILLVGTCLSVFLVGGILARRITRPITLLERGARELGSGDLSHRVEVNPRDELERLAIEFNQMADNLERSRQEIETAARERERLYRETSNRAKEMSALHLVTLEIGAQLDLNALLQSLVRRAVELMCADAGAVFFCDADGQELGLVISYRYNLLHTNIRLPRGQGVAGQVLLTGQPMMINDYPNWPGRAEIFDDWPYAVAAASLFGAERMLGVLEVTSHSATRPFNLDDLDLLSRFAAQAAVAIQNANAYRAEKEAHLLAQKVREAALMLGNSLDLDELLDGIWEQLGQVVAYDSAVIFLLEGDTLKARSAVGFAPEVQVESLAVQVSDDVLFDEIARTGQVLVLPDARADSRFRGYAGTGGVRGWMGVPLFARGRLIGCMTLDKYQPDFYRPQDAKTAQAFAAQAALALENARLYAEEQQRTADLAAALEERQELDRLKNEFIQNTSHELRMPLALIRGYAELLEIGELGEIQPSQRQAINVMYRRACDLTDLVDGLTILLQNESGAVVRTQVYLQDVAEQTVGDFQLTAENRNLKLRLQVEEGIPPIQGDPEHLRRVLDNLASNAFKFTPEGGTVTIRMRPEDDGVYSEVADTGIGIPKDKLHRVFERFYQVDGSARRRHGGVGLGLALVKEIVETHGGHVGILSQVGQGTTVWFWLPGKRET